MPKYRVAVQHVNTKRITRYDVEADSMLSAAAEGLTEHDQNSADERYLIDVVSIWRTNIPYRARKKRK